MGQSNRGRSAALGVAVGQEAGDLVVCQSALQNRPPNRRIDQPVPNKHSSSPQVPTPYRGGTCGEEECGAPPMQVDG